MKHPFVYSNICKFSTLQLNKKNNKTPNNPNIICGDRISLGHTPNEYDTFFCFSRFY